MKGFFTPGSDQTLVDWVVADMSSAPPEVGLPALESAITFEPEILRGLQQLYAPIVALNPDYRPTDV